jgi:hypothetical protein
VSRTKRSEIEKRIQQLSMEFDKILREQMQQELAQNLDMKKLDEMLSEWHQLYRYYKDRNYSENVIDKDLDISIFMVKNYLYWTEYCEILMYSYESKGQKYIVAAFNEAVSTLEYTMQEIMKTVRDFDDYEV